MINLQRGFIAPLLLALLSLLLIGGGAYVYVHNKQASKSESNSTAQATTTSAVPSQLAIDLSTVTPQFVDDGGEGKYVDGTPLPDYILNIKKDIAAYFPSSQDGYNYYSRASNIYVMAIGKRYVLFGDALAKSGTPDEIFDSVTQTSAATMSWFAQIFHTNTYAVYASPGDICTYTLDQPSCVPLPGANSSGGEYWDSMGGSYWITETHTNTSLTIGVFNPDTGKKVRDVTFKLP